MRPFKWICIYKHCAEAEEHVADLRVAGRNPVPDLNNDWNKTLLLDSWRMLNTSFAVNYIFIGWGKIKGYTCFWTFWDLLIAPG